jgi:hypothetical protein
MVTIDLTGLVQEWINGSPNFGFLLYSTGPNHILRYSSKENIAADEHPKLQVSYSVPVLRSNSLSDRMAPSPTTNDIELIEVRQFTRPRKALFD